MLKKGAVFVKKILCVIVVITLVFLLASCKSVGNDTSSNVWSANASNVKDTQISLLYSSGDSFNPYTAKTKDNRELSRLLYDPLIKWNNEFSPTYCLAQSAVCEGKVCTVTIKSAYFTDGTAVTAQDVIYSYNLAKNSETVYAGTLYEVVSVSGDGNNLVFTLDRVDPYFLNLLDFPVIKAGSDGQKTSDGVEIPPIGSGRYYVSDDRSILIRNDGYFGKLSAASKITLINAPDEISASHYVEVGAADIYYADESVNNIARMSGKRADVNTNNFVYIGINGAYGPLSSDLVRYALSAAIDRGQICHTAYFDNAIPASGFFNPALKETEAVQSLKTAADMEITVENLQQIGYNRSVDGYFVNESGKPLSFTLLVNSDNASRVSAANLIAAQCRAAGIEIKVIQRAYSEYLSLLSSGNFQLYLGEIRVLPNMDMSNLVMAGGSASYGVTSAVDENGAPTKTVCGQMIDKYRRGECSLADLAGAFLTEMPQIPVCYRSGMLFYTSRIKNTAQPSACDIFFSFEDCKF